MKLRNVIRKIEENTCIEEPCFWTKWQKMHDSIKQVDLPSRYYYKQNGYYIMERNPCTMLRKASQVRNQP